MKGIKLHWWIILGMVVGAASGAVVYAAYPAEIVESTAVYQAFDGIAVIFLKLLKMVVIPLVFFSLISGMLGMGTLARLGRIGSRTFLLYVTTSLLAIVTGLILVNVIRPGVGFRLTIPVESVAREVPGSVWEVIANMIPDNVVRAAAEFDLFGVIIFALLFGVFMLPLEGERKRTLVSFMEGAFEVMMRMTGFIIALAPFGIAALIARLVSSTGLNVFLDMKWYVLTVFTALAVHLLVTLPLIVFLMTRRNPYRYLRVMSPALLTGFSTASSSGTLPITLERAEHGAGISNRVASFVLPLGATINMDGTALYEIVSVLFIAQIHAGIDPNFALTFGQQLLIVFLGLSVSIGAAGIPHAGLVMMVIILQAVGLPLEYTALIWAVDRVLDMCRTAVNIASDSCITLVVADAENQVDDSVLWERSSA
jgi:Na+/H+-dicarboxylate symporter